MSKTDERRFGTEIPTQPFPDAEQVNLKDILGLDILVKDALTLEGENGEYLILNFERPDNPGDYSTACGGVIVCRKVLQAIKDGMLPLVGKIEQFPSKVKGHSPYYDIN